jgi:hypothetical protein
MSYYIIIVNPKNFSEEIICKPLFCFDDISKYHQFIHYDILKFKRIFMSCFVI